LSCVFSSSPRPLGRPTLTLNSLLRALPASRSTMRVVPMRFACAGTLLRTAKWQCSAASSVTAIGYTFLASRFSELTASSEAQSGLGASAICKSAVDCETASRGRSLGSCTIGIARTRPGEACSSSCGVIAKPRFAIRTLASGNALTWVGEGEIYERTLTLSRLRVAGGLQLVSRSLQTRLQFGPRATADKRGPLWLTA
jgi:hypothetical protein